MINKKIALAAAVAAMFAVPAKADMLGLYVGAQGWQNEANGGFAEEANVLDFSFEDKTNASFYAKFEHPLPLIPNVRARTGKLEADGQTRLTSSFTFDGKTYSTGTDLDTTLNFTNSDISLYWELLDNDIIGFDFGITAKYLSGDFNVDDGSGNLSVEDASLWIPMGYLAAKVRLPFVGVYAYGDANLISYDDNSIHDYEVGVGYDIIDNLAVDVAITAGYREVKVELNDVDDIYANLDFSGFFAGIEVHF
ncbi:TIGR04219 family outer membrane beta-barrel protein [Psychrobium sp. 1_MG-2023]|uniref:TIGR04219 family outer membrane beta-barrel protein n=1 Tax=Psychrobium sp. 1_MG-2023 TaxID=3062624 RepID=UPI000C3258D2|nr:TIGR04219 family outer membrane beta-barrel protein [Psychrobium sp. 1_MG-2023]MDP2560099.1 TIGR04219 family outer membrane beta-barrel protein [Psychrobium sp. 1_MG-2023]PKF56243.1 hypothetical protein CW748_09760 [Alteromonadales bacterium alter-6D02]